MNHTVSPLEESSAVVVAGKPKRVHRSTVEVVNLHSDLPHLTGNQEGSSICPAFSVRIHSLRLARQRSKELCGGLAPHYPG